MLVYSVFKCVLAAFMATTPVSAVFFGTATDKPSTYGDLVPSSFNLLTAENVMTWGYMERTLGNVNYQTTKDLLTYSINNSMKLRGGTFVWHTLVPNFIFSLTGAKLEAAIDARIKGIFDNIDHENIIAWDVVKEAIADDGSNPMRISTFTEKMGNNFVETVFRIARKYAPSNVKLFYNDYNCEVSANQKATRCYDLVNDLHSKGLVDGMGFQMHLSLKFGEESQMSGFAETMKRYTDLGLEVHITEMDVSIANTPGSDSELLEMQASWYRNIASICVANPNCTSFIVAGVIDSDSFRFDGKPLLFTSNAQKKPAYDAIASLLKPPTTPPMTTTVIPTTATPIPPTTSGIVCNYEGKLYAICRLANAWSYENGTVCVGITRCVSQSPPYGIVIRSVH